MPPRNAEPGPPLTRASRPLASPVARLFPADTSSGRRAHRAPPRPRMNPAGSRRCIPNLGPSDIQAGGNETRELRGSRHTTSYTSIDAIPCVGCPAGSDVGGHHRRVPARRRSSDRARWRPPGYAGTSLGRDETAHPRWQGSSPAWRPPAGDGLLGLAHIRASAPSASTRRAANGASGSRSASCGDRARSAMLPRNDPGAGVGWSLGTDPGARRGELMRARTVFALRPRWQRSWAEEGAGR